MNGDASWLEGSENSPDDEALAERIAELGDLLREGGSIDTEDATEPDTSRKDQIRQLVSVMRMLTRDPADQSSSLFGVDSRLSRTLGDFRILREIGRGGMGIVYEAIQISLNRRVAFKILPHGSTYDVKQIRRFQVEAQAAGRLSNSHIVPVYVVGVENGVYFYAMQLISGRTVAELIASARRFRDSRPPEGSADDRLTPRMVAELGRQAAEAIAFAHRENVIHRDIKPANLLVERSGWLWVADFGLARLEDHGDYTTGGILWGTPRYMSPEQARGDTSAVDPRTDIYSLGVTLYEMLTLRPAFDGEDHFGTLQRVVLDEPKRLRRYDPEIPVDLETIVLKAMAKQPAERYASAELLASDLQRFLDYQPIQARPRDVARSIACWVGNRRSTVAICMAMVMIAVGAARILTSWQDSIRNKYENTLSHARAAAESSRVASQRLWRSSQLHLAQQELSSGHVELAQEILERVRPAPNEATTPVFEWRYLRRLAQRERVLLFGHNAPIQAVAASLDGTRLVTGDYDGVIIFWDLKSWRELARTQAHEASVDIVAMTPDGSLAASISEKGGKSDVKLWNPSAPGKGILLEGTSERVRTLVFARNGRTLALWEMENSGSTPRVSFWDVSHGPQHATRIAEVSDCWTVTVSPDRRQIATAGRSGRVTIRELTSGKAVSESSQSFESIQAIGYTPDRRYVAVSNGKDVTFIAEENGSPHSKFAVLPGGILYLTFDVLLFHGLPLRNKAKALLVDPTSNCRQTTLDMPVNESSRFAFSPDGRLLAASGTDTRTTLWDLGTGKARAGIPDIASTVTFAADGQSLFLGSSDAKIRLVRHDPSPDPVIQWTGHAAEVWTLAYTQDGQTLISGADDHLIKLWNTSGRQLRATLKGHTALVASVDISPDGKTLASGSFDRTVRLWDLASLRTTATLAGHVDRVRSVKFSPDGTLLASASSDGTIRLWDCVHPERAARTLYGHTDSVHALTFDPVGQRLVSTGNDKVLRIWNVVSGKQNRVISCTRKNTAIAFSRDGLLLATGDDWGNITIWDATTWSKLREIKGSASPVRSLAFSPDDQTLAVGCGDARIRLLDPATGQLTLVLDRHAQRVNAVAFTPQGQTLASASHDGVLQLWDGQNPESP